MARPSPPHDPQREKLYLAEDTFAAADRYRLALKRADIKRVARKALGAYGIRKLPKIKFIRRPEHWVAAYLEADAGTGANQLIVVNTHFVFDLPSLLHELAHAIDASVNPNEKALDHGPRFCGIASWLYDHFKVMPWYAYELILKKHKVRYLTASECSPEKLKAR